MVFVLERLGGMVIEVYLKKAPSAFGTSPKCDMENFYNNLSFSVAFGGGGWGQIGEAHRM